MGHPSTKTISEIGGRARFDRPLRDRSQPDTGEAVAESITTIIALSAVTAAVAGGLLVFTAQRIGRRRGRSAAGTRGQLRLIHGGKASPHGMPPSSVLGQKSVPPKRATQQLTARIGAKALSLRAITVRGIYRALAVVRWLVSALAGAAIISAGMWFVGLHWSLSGPEYWRSITLPLLVILVFAVGLSWIGRILGGIALGVLGAPVTMDDLIADHLSRADHSRDHRPNA